MISGHDEERDLALAFRAVRDRFDGTHPEADATLRRALLATRKQKRSRRFVHWVVLPLAAALAASTVWAATTGRLAPIFSSVTPSTPAVATSASMSPSMSAAAPVGSAASVEVAPVGSVEAMPAIEPIIAHAPALPSTASAPASPAASASASESDPNAALFADAHRVHFAERDPARALAAWDRYLAAAPSGRFAPEARYNRALSLVRLGRQAEAKTELTAFANGAYGEYRRSEARALLDAMSRDE